MAEQPDHLTRLDRSSHSQTSQHNVIRTRQSGSRAEDLFLGAVLPVVGLTVPSSPSMTLSKQRQFDEESIHSRLEEYSAIPVHSELNCSEKKFNEIPKCDPVSVYIQNICVEVKVVQPVVDSKTSMLRRIYQTPLTFVGIGTGGETIQKKVLFDISGSFKPSCVVALMGPSGAGKSTLLNVLSRRVQQTQGTVLYNTTIANETTARNCSAFVQQLDLFLSNLTVHEQLESQIELRLPPTTPKDVRIEREHILCQEMSLIKCRNTIIGTGEGMSGISGGERKRLNVASELTRLPAVLYADEPTTGLDSFTAESVVTVLRKLADSGRTVVATIHQPSSKIFEMFDTLVLLAEGHLIYFGDRLGCLEWLSALGFKCPPFSNPADFIIKVVSTPENKDQREKKLIEIAKWGEHWKTHGKRFLEAWSTKGKENFLHNLQSFTEVQKDISLSNTFITSPKLSFNLLDDLKSSKPFMNELLVTEDDKLMISHSMHSIDAATAAPLSRLSWFRQILILHRRAIRANKRDKFLVHARAAQTFVLATVFGLLFLRLGWDITDSQARGGGLYMLLLNQSMSGAFAVTNTFVLEKPVIKREHESGLIYASSYMIAKMLADVPIQIIFPIIFCTIGYWLMGLNDNFVQFIIVVAIMLLVANAAMSIGYFASAMADSPETAAIICNLSVLPLTIFGGFMVKLEDSPKWLSWIQYISFVKYGFSGGLVTIFRDEEVILDNNTSVDGLSFINTWLGIDDSQYALSFVLLFVLFVSYRAIGCFAYEFKMRRAKENI